MALAMEFFQFSLPRFSGKVARVKAEQKIIFQFSLPRFLDGDWLSALGFYGYLSILFTEIPMDKGNIFFADNLSFNSLYRDSEMFLALFGPDLLISSLSYKACFAARGSARGFIKGSEKPKAFVVNAYKSHV